ncbi:MAG: Gluconolactonase, partial [uncultured Solirubrobacteraceae bacterium]
GRDDAGGADHARGGGDLRAPGDRRDRHRDGTPLRQLPALVGGRADLGGRAARRRRAGAVPGRALERVAERAQEPDDAARPLGVRAERRRRRARQPLGARPGRAGDVAPRARRREARADRPGERPRDAHDRLRRVGGARGQLPERRALQPGRPVGVPDRLGRGGRARRRGPRAWTGAAGPAQASEHAAREGRDRRDGRQAAAASGWARRRVRGRWHRARARRAAPVLAGAHRTHLLPHRDRGAARRLARRRGVGGPRRALRPERRQRRALDRRRRTPVPHRAPGERGEGARPRGRTGRRAAGARAGRAAALAGHVQRGTGRDALCDRVAHHGHAVVRAREPATGAHDALPPVAAGAM